MKAVRLALGIICAIVCAVGVAVSQELAPMKGAVLLAPKPDLRPRIAIVIDDLGLDWRRFHAANNLPFPATLGFLPYGVEAQAMLDAASDRHEPILHLPMEAYRATAPSGPDTVKVGSAGDIRRAMATNFAKLSGYKGVNNHTGSKLTSHRRSMILVLSEVMARDLYFLDSGTTVKSISRQVGQDLGATVVQGRLFLDGDRGTGGEAHVRQQLRLLEREALKHGAAIGIGHPYPSTISALLKWEADARVDFRLVTAGELAAEKKRHLRPQVASAMR